MRFSIQVRDVGSPDSDIHEEEYEDFSVNTEEEAVQWGKQTIDMFNSTLRAGERAREFLGAKILGAGRTPHDWRKASLFNKPQR